MYKFIRLKDNRTGLKYPFILLCETKEVLLEHTEKYMTTEIKKGVEDFMKITNTIEKLDNESYSKSKTSHYTSGWAIAIDTITKNSDKPWYEHSVMLENKVFQGKMKCLLNHGNILLRDSGSYMTISPDMEIIEEIIKDEMIYPNYSEENISITKWEGGRHYYATIGNMTVVDKDGNQKWNSHNEAMKHAKEYLKTF